MRKIFHKSTAAFVGAVLAVTPMAQTADAYRSSALAADNTLLAFPGAVGGGKYATGGRGGEVYHVTNLNDSGAGSLRDAVSKPNRIVVFDVSGTIELQSNIVCTDNITVAGQTAPGGSGVTLKNYKFGMGGDNIIVRYLSSRPGADKCTSSGNDAWGGAKGSNSIIDHCSLGWTTDEQWGLYSNNDHYTVQYSVIGPANSWGGHVKGIHGFGLMMGRSNLTFDHNLIIHNVSRNFRGKVVGTETADFTNNIIYDWGYQTAYGTIGHVNYVNNTLKAGNSTTGGYHYVQVQSSDNFMIYMNGNRILNKDNSVRNAENNNWSAMEYKHSDKTRANTEVTTPFTIMWNGENISTATTCESAADSYEHVISFAGNGISPDKRTKIDRQCADETKNGTGQCSGTEAYDSSQSGLDKYNIKCGVVYEYPSAVTKKEIADADNDGMDDSWELARGLDPNDPSDYKGDYCGDGYMNIEYYINDLTVDSFPAGVVELSPEVSPVTPDPITGTLISSVEVLDTAYYKSWGVDTSLGLGDAVFGDRTAEKCAVSELPTKLSGAELVLTPCDAKASSKQQAELTAAQDITLYVGFDERVTAAPDWAAGWNKDSAVLKTSNGVTFVLYSKEVRAGGSVTLGANGQSAGCMNYIVLATAGSAAPLGGDVNADGEFGAADLVLLQKWLLGSPDSQLADWQAGDLCKDDRLDSFDLVLMRRKLLNV
ncbi:MAG: dockerin type I domain-containing protein [Ruminococcus sp.]|nr:dockerin type I domain-containing protein [Ruminococcus sp.]